MIPTLSTPLENNNQEKYKDNASVAQAYSLVYQKPPFLIHEGKEDQFSKTHDCGSWCSLPSACSSLS